MTALQKLADALIWKLERRIPDQTGDLLDDRTERAAVGVMLGKTVSETHAVLTALSEDDIHIVERIFSQISLDVVAGGRYWWRRWNDLRESRICETISAGAGEALYKLARIHAQGNGKDV